MIAAERLRYLQDRIARADDQYAYKELFAAFYSYLMQFGMSLVRSRQTAEEVVSDVFIKIWQKRGDLHKISDLRIYLYVATRNTALNYLDKQKRLDSKKLEFASRPSGFSFDPEQLMITTEMMARIEKAIDHLPPKCKVIFKLVKEDCLKYREVSEILNISVKTVENQLAIALRKIGSEINFEIEKTIPTPV